MKIVCSFKKNLKIYPNLKFKTSEIDAFFKENKYLSMYAQERRKVTGKKSNFSRDTQPYIFSNLPFESFELGQFINYIIQLCV